MATTPDQVVPAESAVEKIANGFQFTEGPVWIPSRSELLFSDIHANRIYRWKEGRVEVWRDPSGQANGNTLDREGRLVTCEHANRRVSRSELDGTVGTLADRFEGRRLNSPNDVVCKRDGAIYFTDPPYGVKPEDRELDFQGVFRLVPGANTLALLARDFIKPNGLAFSPDERLLYIADTEQGHIRTFDVAHDGSIGNSRVFCQIERPDGMKVDIEGNLYVAGMTGVVVFDKAGKQRGIIPTPLRPSNLAFGEVDRKTLFITARSELYRIRVKIAGCRLA